MYPLSHGACVTHSVCVCVCVYVCVCVCVCVYACVCVCVRECMHACEHVYIYNALTSHVCLWRYIEAVRRLKKEGRSFLRTIHLTFMPGRPHAAHNGQQWDLVCVPAPATARVEWRNRGWGYTHLAYSIPLNGTVNMILLDGVSPGNVRTVYVQTGIYTVEPLYKGHSESRKLL